MAPSAGLERTGQEAWLERLFALSDEIACVTDLRGEIHATNLAWMTRRSSRPRWLHELFTPAARERLEAARAQAGAGRVTRDSAEVAPDGPPVEVRLGLLGDDRLLVTILPRDPDGVTGSALARLAGVGLALMDGEGRYRYVNDAYCGIYGYARDELLGNVFTMVVAPAQQETALANHRAVLESDTDCTRELQVRRRDGSPMTIDTSSRRIMLPGGEALRLATVLDVTSVRIGERRLAEAESRLRAFTESLPGAVYQFRHESDGTRHFSYMSRGLYDIGGFDTDYPLDDFDTFMSLVPDEDRLALANAIAASERTLQPLRHEFRLLTPAGTLWVEARSTPARHADGSVVCNGFIDDVTERVRAQRALAEQRNRLDEIVENNVSALLITDADGDIVHANPRARAILRLQRSDSVSLGQVPARLAEPDGHDLAPARNPLQQVIRAGAPVEDMRFALRWDDGVRQLLSVNGAPIFGEDGAIERIAFSFTDVTQGIEAQLRAILEHTPAIVYLKDLEGRFLYINPEFTRRYRVSEDWLHGRTVFDLFPPEEAEAFTAHDRTTRAEGRVTNREIRVPRIEGEEADPVYNALKFPVVDEHGTTVALAGVEVDVTQRRQVERALVEERNLLNEIVGTSVSALLITDPAGGVVHANPRARELLRMGQTDHASLLAVAARITEIDGSELARERHPLQRVLAAGAPVTDMRLSLYWEDGTRQIVSINGSPLFGAEDDVDRIVFSIADLTSEIEAHEKLEQQNALLQSIFEESSETLIVTDTERHIRMVNPAFTVLFGYREDEILGHTTRELYADEEDYERIGLSYRDEPGNKSARDRLHTVRFRSRNGRVFFAETVTDNLNDADGNHIGYVGLIRDITTRKQAEEELQRQTRLYAGLVESTSAILWEADPETFHFTFVSGEAENLLGYPAERWTGEPDFWVEHIHPEDREWAPAYCRRATAEQRRHQFDYRMLAADGRTVWLRDVITVLVEDGRPHKLVGAMIDITETKEAERELARSEARFRELYHRTPVMLHSIDRDGRIVAVSGYWLGHLGYSEEEVLGHRSSEFLTEESARRAREEVLPEFFRTGSCRNVPYQVVRADGEVIDVLLSAVAQYDDDGEIVRSLAVMTDVTVQRRAEAEYRDIFNNASEGIYRTSPDGRLLRANPALVHLHGFDTEDELLAASTDLARQWYVDSEDRDRITGLLQCDGHVENFEARIYRCATGERIWVSENARAVRDERGEVAYYEGTMFDITKRVRKEQELARSEARFRTLYHDTPVMLHSADAAGVITDVNSQWLRQLGYQRDEVIGHQVTEFLTEASRKRAEQNYMPALLAEGSAEELEFRLRRKDGEIREVLLSSSVVYGEHGDIEGLLSVLTDITERRRLEAEYRDIFENSNEGMYRSTPGGRLLRANPALARMHGFDTPEELLAAVEDLNTDWYVDPDARPKMQRRLHQHGYVDSFEAEVRPLNADGRIWTSETVHLTRDAQGIVLYYEGTVRDVTAEHKARELARLRNSVLEMIARDDAVTGILHEIINITEQQHERLTAAIFRLQDGRLYSAAAPALANACIEAVDGATPSEVGSAIQAALHGERESIDGAPGADGTNNPFVEAVHASGYAAVLATPIRDQQGRVLGVLAAFAAQADTFDLATTELLREMAQIASIAIEQHRLSEELLRQAQYDTLTELPNRALLSDRLEHAIQEAERDEHLVGVLLLDLDEFKLVNDSLGHSAGDQLLQEVALHLRDCLRAGDTVARLGGDEFVLVVPLHQEADYCNDIAERVLATLQRPIRIADHEVTARPSIGVSMYPQDGRTAEALLQAADTAMYAAKHAGKNRYRYFAESMNRQVSARLQIESELQDALAHEQLELHYQPRVALDTGMISGAETLLRWRHPERGLLLPGEFIQVAERGPLISDIDRLVLNHAAERVAAWQRERRNLLLSVNLSARELHADGFAAEVARILERFGVDPSGLEIEITESMLMYDFERASRQLLDLKERAPGLNVAIDDFGSGYSSLNYLRHLPIDTLKIDRSFVVELAGAAETGTAAAIAKTIVELAHNLHMTVVAEGVEHLDQLRVLRGFGCEEAQGFLFDRALPVEEFKHRLQGDQGYAIVREV